MICFTPFFYILTKILTKNVWSIQKKLYFCDVKELKFYNGLKIKIIKKKYQNCLEVSIFFRTFAV